MKPAPEPARPETAAEPNLEDMHAPAAAAATEPSQELPADKQMIYAIVNEFLGTVTINNPEAVVGEATRALSSKEMKQVADRCMLSWQDAATEHARNPTTTQPRLRGILATRVCYRATLARLWPRKGRRRQLSRRESNVGEA